MEKRNQSIMYADQDITLLDILNCVLDKGVIVQGTLLVSIANIDLIYIDLKLIVTSVETAIKNNMIQRRAVGMNNRNKIGNKEGETRGWKD